MVSIRYFLGVGEFCRMKSRPLGRFTSNTGPTRAAADNATVATNNALKAFSNLGILCWLGYRARHGYCTLTVELIAVLLASAESKFSLAGSTGSVASSRFVP